MRDSGMMRGTDEPEIRKPYTFRRAFNGIIERITFTRFDDGGAYVVGDNEDTFWEESEDAWKLALSDLKARGFIAE